MNKNLYLLKEVFDEESKKRESEEPILDKCGCQVRGFIKAYIRKLRNLKEVEYQIDGEQCDHDNKTDNENSVSQKMILFMIWFTEF